MEVQPPAMPKWTKPSLFLNSHPGHKALTSGGSTLIRMRLSVSPRTMALVNKIESI